MWSGSTTAAQPHERPKAAPRGRRREALYWSRHEELFNRYGEARSGSSPSQWTADGHGKYVELTPKQFRILKGKGQSLHHSVRITLDESKREILSS